MKILDARKSIEGSSFPFSQRFLLHARLAPKHRSASHLNHTPTLASTIATRGPRTRALQQRSRVAPCVVKERRNTADGASMHVTSHQEGTDENGCQATSGGAT